MKKNIDLYYFTGTGNTFIVSKKMKEVFERNGISVNLYKIEKSDPSKINLKNTIGLAFPIAGFATFPFVLDFIRLLPNANGTEIFAVDTFAGTSGGIFGYIKKILTKKGYTCIGAKGIKMPSNIFYVYKDAINNKIVEKGIEKAETYASDLVNGKSRWNRFPVLSDIFYYFSLLLLSSWKIKIGQKYFAYKLIKEKCTKCGICAKICPVQNIEMDEYPKYMLKCQYCLRCVSFCPEKALEIPFNYKKITYKAVDVKEILE
ncbi:MAG: EFR1 family ferrodoxin [Elusimicrobia bacterium]|nr:EFR1 family ferrodoxin [Elusimicrobiota bacterium]